MDLTWLFKEKYRRVFEKLYMRHLELSKNTIKKPLPYSKTSLADDLDVSRSAVTQTLKPFQEHGLIEVRTNHIDLTEEGLVYWRVLTTPMIDEVKQVIKKIHDSQKYGISGWEYEGLSELAHRASMKLGSDPENDKPVMALIYAVMSMPDMEEYLEKKPFPFRC